MDVVELDVEQQRCVVSDSAHTLIVAGPGSGKTRTVVAKCTALLAAGAAPDSIICITFTNKAAEELRHRIQHKGVRAGTYHHVALTTLRAYRVGVFAEEYTLLTTSTEASRSFKTTLTAHNVSWGAHASAVLQLYHGHRIKADQQQTPPALLSATGVTLVPAFAVQECFTAYHAHKASHYMVDYDDLLHMWLQFLQSSTADAALEHARTHVVFADEVQDSNDVQHAILVAFASHGATIVAVGDPDQSIYGFRGSNMQHIMEFVRTMPGAVQHTLCNNYRSTPQIVRLCEHLVDYNYNRIQKQMHSMCDDGPVPALYQFDTTRAENDFVLSVCEKALRHSQECAVLCRTNREVDVLAELLDRRHVPYAPIKGSKLMEAPHVQQLLLLYKFVFQRDPSAEVIRDVALLHKISKTAAGKLVADLQRDTVEDSIAAVLTKLHNAVVPPQLHAWKATLTGLRSALVKIHAHTDGLEEEHYKAHAMQLGCACVQHLIQLNCAGANSLEQSELMKVEKARGHFKSFDAFFDLIVLGGGLVGDDSDAFIKIGTIHQAKGLEFESCVITGCADGSIPLATSTSCLKDVEEERRLLFVAASRAKHQLCFTFALHAAWDSEGAKTRRLSQFLRPLLTVEPPVIEVKQATHVIQTAPTPVHTTCSLHDVVNSFLSFFGRHNKLYAAANAMLNFKPFQADVRPCPLFGAAKATASSSFLSPGAQNELLFKHVFLAMFRTPDAEWQSLVDAACQQTWAEQLTQAQRASRILRGTQADAGLPNTTWPSFMDALQLLSDRLLAADVQRLAVNRAIKQPQPNDGMLTTTVDLVIDHTLFAVCYAKDEGTPSQPVVHLLAQQRLLEQTQRYEIRTLVIYNIYTGQLWRAPVPSADKLHDFARSLPPLMQATPLVKLLLHCEQ